MMSSARDHEAVRARAQADKLSKKPYADILAQPMPKWTVLTGPTDEEYQALIDEKFKALFAHYEIDSEGAFDGGPNMASAWANLAFRLAREHVPGFRGPPRLRGRPAERKFDDVTLVLRVELLTRRHGMSVIKAIGEITAQNLVAGTEMALLQRYKRAKDSFVPLSRMFDRVAEAKGHDVLVRILEESMSGDDKDIFLSPD